MPKLPMGDIGPCVIIWDYEGTPICLGPYLGTVALRGADTISDVQEEGYGDATVDGVSAGTVLELDVPMARSLLHHLANTIGYENMGSLTGNVLTLRNWAGCSMYENAKQIIIAPVCNNVADTDPHSWILLYKAHPWRDFELTYDRSGQRIHMCKFKIFPNQDSGYCGEYGTWGLASGATAITGICT